MFRSFRLSSLYFNQFGNTKIPYFKLDHKFYLQHSIHSCDKQQSRLQSNAHVIVSENNNIGNKESKSVTTKNGENQTLLQRLVLYIEKNTYMEDVRLSQQHVMDIKKKLLSAGEEKRSLMKKLEDIRNDLNHTYKDMKINRAKETYIDLARKEIELCELEKQYSDMYKQVDKEEQFLFTEFSAAINDSYEKEKLHTNFIKIISIIGTLASSFIALVFSIFMHSYQQKNFFHQRSLDDKVVKSVEALETKLSGLLTEMNQNINKKHEVAGKKVVKETESWGSYLHRHTRWIYGWAPGLKSS